MAECTQATLTSEGKEDGRRAHPELSKRLNHVIDLLLTVPAHLVVTSHYMEVGGGDDDGKSKPKSGKGLAPLMPNLRSRSEVAAKFHDIVWFEKAGGGVEASAQYKGRIFVTAEDGVFGPGGRHLKGASIIPGHIGTLIEQSSLAGKRTKPAAKPAVNGPPPKPQPKPQPRPVAK